MYRWVWIVYVFMLLIGHMRAYAQTPEQDTPKMRWSGDLRMRWQGDFEPRKRARNVLQYRVRLNMSIPVNDRIEFGGRLMTGDPLAIVAGGDVNASDFLARKDIVIAWLYARYRPRPDVTFIAGKFASPFFRATQLVYDTDLATEGLGQQFHFSNDDNSTAFDLNLSEVFINQPVSSTSDISRTFLLGGQALAKVKRSKTSGTFALAVYGAGNADSIYAALNLRSPPLLRSPNTNRPNALKTGYLSNFRVVNVGMQVTRATGSRPLTLSVDYAVNPGASNERQAIAGVLTYGSARRVGGTRVGIHGFHIESDAVLSAFSNTDYMQTNSNGVGVFVNYQPIKNVTIDIIAYTRKYDKPSSLVKPVTRNPFRTRMRFQLMLQF